MRIYLDSIGCRLNQSEIEMFARQFHSAGHTLVATPQEADLAIVNTCSVTAKAESDSRQKIRRLINAGANDVIVTGCWATLEPEKVAALPGVSRVITNPFKDDLPILAFSEDGHLENDKRTFAGGVPGPRHRTRTFLKVQDGCNNHCTYCVTVLARGRARSRRLENVISDIQSAYLSGTQEVILSGVHLGSWGEDLEGKSNLRELIEAILMQTDIPRLRLSSLEPWDLDDHFFDLWRDPRLCRHLHLPLQSGCNATLRRMARHTTQQAYYSIVASLRKVIPDVALTTDIIAGFPGETDEEFSESMAFVRKLDFAGGHVFTYSERPGTVAAMMPDQIPMPVRKKRNAEMRVVFSETSLRYRQHFIGKKLEVLWESAVKNPDGSFLLSGLTDNYLRVRSNNERDLWNRISLVHMLAMLQEDMIGVIE
ncbi:MAG: tRNA (N(6)-L-threonylcarbamoyladenosine(37)-C(2))-methylthiotransferase MtaB [Chloroflexota bacterium]